MVFSNNLMDALPLRSLLKTITYRFLMFIYTSVAVFIITGNLGLAAGVAVIDTILKFIIYYLHERVWNYIDWGRKTK